MDQGIIMNYHRLPISKLIDSHDNNTTMTASVYTAILLIHKAWRLVTQVCIQNCYRRGGFQQTAETVSHNDYNDIPLLHLQNNWCQLTREGRLWDLCQHRWWTDHSRPTHRRWYRRQHHKPGRKQGRYRGYQRIRFDQRPWSLVIHFNTST